MTVCLRHVLVILSAYVILLYFAVPPTIRDGEQEVAVVENSQAQLVCAADGFPQPSLSWEKDGIPLSESTAEYTILPSGELVIDTAQVE